MGEQDTSQKFVHADIQVVGVQHPHIRIRGMDVDARGVRSLEWCELKHGKCDNRPDCQGRSIRRQNLRPAALDKSQETPMSWSYTPHGTRKKIETSGVHHVQGTATRRSADGCTRNKFVERTVYICV